MKKLPIANGRFGNHFPDAVLPDAAMMAVRSPASCRSADSFRADMVPDSISSSSHNAVSSASSSTVPILAMNSAWLRARQQAR